MMMDSTHFVVSLDSAGEEDNDAPAMRDLLHDPNARAIDDEIFELDVSWNNYARGNGLQRQRGRNVAVPIERYDGQHGQNERAFIQRGGTTPRAWGIRRGRTGIEGNQEPGNHLSIF